MCQSEATPEHKGHGEVLPSVFSDFNLPPGFSSNLEGDHKRDLNPKIYEYMSLCCHHGHGTHSSVCLHLLLSRVLYLSL